MIFINKMKDLKIYKKPLFLPTVETSKKKNSAVFLLTPNRESSLGLMKSPLLINKLRFESYYIEKDLTYFIDSKVLKKDDSTNENYLRFSKNDTVVKEDTTYDEIKLFADNIFYSGYENDVDIAKVLFDGEVYKTFYTEDLALSDADPNNIPYIHITMQSRFDELDTYKTWYRNNGGKLYISIEIPTLKQSQDKNEYMRNVLGFICTSIMCAIYPTINGTQLPYILSDYIIGYDNLWGGKYGTYLFGDDDNDPVMTKSQYANICATGDINQLVNILHNKFPDVTVKDIAPTCGTKVTAESGKESITMENIGKKFKYASTTKLKRATSRKVNGIKRLINTIKDNLDARNTIFNAPTMSPSVSVSSHHESTVNELADLKENEDYFLLGDNRVLFVNESNKKYDIPLKRILYNDRIKQRKQILQMDNQIKLDDKDIKYAYPDLDRYCQKNLFIDLEYYNEVFFRNNTFKLKKAFDIYLELLDRLINDPRVADGGYKLKTVFIPVLDWTHNPDTRMWLYRESINPVSIIYQLMYTQSAELKRVFKDLNIVFFSRDAYFKLNFDNMSSKELKTNSIMFKNFISKMIHHGEFAPEEIDNDEDSLKQSPEAIKANIYDAIDRTKGVDLTGKELVNKEKHKVEDVKTKGKVISAPKGRIIPGEIHTVDKKDTKALKDIDAKAEEDEDKNLSIAVDKEEKARRDEELERLATLIDDISSNSSDTNDALDAMDKDGQIKDILNDLGTNNVNISATRSARINTLTNNFLDNNVKDNKTVKDILSENPSKESLDTVSLKIGSPNQEWNNLKYINFDKDYDLNRDVVNCFKHFSEVSLPMAIRKLTITDHSTSEDRLDLYTVEMEDYRGKRFTVKLDIPKMIDNRFLLRGNNKIIETQFLNMPILKTDLDTAQVITNYQKIFIRRFRTSSGKSTPIASKLIKALTKYTGKDIQIEYGDNSRICNKYQLPIDYIDMASIFNKISYDGIIIYFNQDVIRNEYDIDDKLGIPFGYDTKSKKVLYYTNMDNDPFSMDLINILYNDKSNFKDTFDMTKSSVSGTYSRCSILSTDIPLIVVAGYTVGLSEIIKRCCSNGNAQFKEKLDQNDKYYIYDHIKFSDGYLVYSTLDYQNSLLFNGLKDCPCDEYTMADMDKKTTYIEFLDNFGGRIKADGLENFNDCLVDPISKEILEYYKLPTNFVDILLYTNTMLADNAFVRHTDTSSRRIRRNEIVAAYTYEALSESYALWANQIRHGRNSAMFGVKQSSVIDKLLSSPITQDDSINNALGSVEETNTISFKGKSGLNSDRSYSLDKRTYDDTMVNVLGMSTGFSANVGITRQATMDMAVDSKRGYISQNNGNTDNMDTAKTLTATEAMVPFCVESDDPQRVAMTFIQTAKHQVRTVNSDPLLVTNGADEAVPYLTTDTFAFKAKKNGKVKELNDQYMIVEYEDKTDEYVDLTKEVKKNSDGGYYIPIQLSAKESLKVGSNVKANDIVAYDKSSFSNSVGEDNNIKYNAGKLAKVAIICSDEGFEDSGICTEKLSKDLATTVIYKFDHIISKDANIFTKASIGDHVDVNDALLVWQDPYDDKNANTVIKAIADENKDNISELGRRAIRSDTSGTVVDMKIYRTCEIDDMSPSMQKLVKSYEAPILKLKKELKDNNISNVDLPATYKLDMVGKLKKAEDSILIEFYVEYTDLVGRGDKYTSFAANKCITKDIIPDKDAPYTEFRPKEQVSAMLGVAGINGRMVTSILRIGSLQKLMIELDRHVKDMMDIPYDDSQV